MMLEHDGQGWVLRLGDIPEAEAQLLGDVLAAVSRAREARGRCGFPGDSLVRVSEAPGVPADVHAWIEAREPRPKRKKSA